MATLSEKRKAEGERLKTFDTSEDDPSPHIQGILLSDQIIYFASHHQMISPFLPENLKPAGYELTVGDQYFLSGEYLAVDDKITIPPFEVAVIKTAETLSLPRYLIARWNIRVRHAYSGLLWVGGPQVDPGYVGHLFCPIYNLSDKSVTLYLGDPLALMDFQKTTPFDKRKPPEELKRYSFPPKRLVIQDYEIDDLKSALFTRAGRKLEEFEDSIRALETRFVTFTQLSFAIFAGVIALLALSAKAAEQFVVSASLVGAVTIGMATWAVLLALFANLQFRLVRLVRDRQGSLVGNRMRTAQRMLRRWWWKGLVISVLLSVGAAWFVFRQVNPFLEGIRSQRLITQEDFTRSARPLQDGLSGLEKRLHSVEGGQVSRDEFERLKDELQRLKSRPQDSN
jgi:deoxycytidine triphosphate deaminase